MAIEEISRLVGHSSSNVTETVYRHQIRPGHHRGDRGDGQDLRQGAVISVRLGDLNHLSTSADKFRPRSPASSAE
jgi:hypothetical protein